MDKEIKQICTACNKPIDNDPCPVRSGEVSLSHILPKPVEMSKESRIAELLWDYSNYLFERGFIDCDFKMEEPYPVDEYIKEKKPQENNYE